MWSPYQIRSDESKDVKTTFEFFTKEKKKHLQRTRWGSNDLLDSSRNYATMSLNDAETRRCRYLPLCAGQQWKCLVYDQTLHSSHLRRNQDLRRSLPWQQSQPKYVDNLGVETPASILARAKTFDDQAVRRLSSPLAIDCLVCRSLASNGSFRATRRIRQSRSWTSPVDVANGRSYVRIPPGYGWYTRKI